MSYSPEEDRGRDIVEMADGAGGHFEPNILFQIFKILGSQCRLVLLQMFAAAKQRRAHVAPYAIRVYFQVHWKLLLLLHS